MAAEKLPGLSTRPASEICPPAGLGDQAAALLARERDASEALAQLIEQDDLAAAIRFLAHALPKADAVWWACEAARVTQRDDEPEANTRALEAARTWVIEPGENTRRSAQQAAEAADPRSPCALAALAAFFADGSMAPPDAPDLPAPDHLTGTMAATAVMLAAATGDPQEIEARQRQFLDHGIQLARG